MARMTLEIGGMSCGHCVAAVRRALEGQPGLALEDVRVGRAVLEYDPAVTSPERIADAVAERGYRVEAR
jgi:copper chaperone